MKIDLFIDHEQLTSATLARHHADRLADLLDQLDGQRCLDPDARTLVAAARASVVALSVRIADVETALAESEDYLLAADEPNAEPSPAAAEPGSGARCRRSVRRRPRKPARHRPNVAPLAAWGAQ